MARATVATRFGEEQDKVDRLMQLLGYSSFSICDPNLTEETGVDVLVELGGRRIGFQVTEFHSDEGSGSGLKGSLLRSEEDRKVADGLPSAMFVKPNRATGLIRRIQNKSRKQWSQKCFPEMILSIASSIPRLPGIVSTFLWDRRMLAAARAELTENITLNFFTVSLDYVPQDDEGAREQRYL